MFFSEETLFTNFCTFCRLQCDTGDIDPVYPFLAKLPLDHEQALWLVLLYVGYYHLGSALTAFSQSAVLRPLSRELGTLPCASERRGFRGGALLRHIESAIEVIRPYQSLTRFLAEGLGSARHENWQSLSCRLQTIWGNGRWAAYKFCDILMSSYGYPLDAPDMGHEFSTGPRKGLALFYAAPAGNAKETIARLDAQGRDLQTRLCARGISLHLAALETMLCDFYSLYDGRYYVGHDLDQMLAHLALLSDPTPYYQIRTQLFPDAYLGERHGWHRPDSLRKRHYRATGEILTR